MFNISPRSLVQKQIAQIDLAIMQAPFLIMWPWVNFCNVFFQAVLMSAAWIHTLALPSLQYPLHVTDSNLFPQVSDAAQSALATSTLATSDLQQQTNISVIKVGLPDIMSYHLPFSVNTHTNLFHGPRPMSMIMLHRAMQEYLADRTVSPYASLVEAPDVQGIVSNLNYLVTWNMLHPHYSTNDSTAFQQQHTSSNIIGSVEHVPLAALLMNTSQYNMCVFFILVWFYNWRLVYKWCGWTRTGKDCPSSHLGVHWWWHH